MASVKLPWEALWRAISNLLVAGRLLLALDDSINPETGKHIFVGQLTFDHAAKSNQTRWPWAQTIVTVGLGCWCRSTGAGAVCGWPSISICAA
jgi:hypothetical protein